MNKLLLCLIFSFSVLSGFSQIQGGFVDELVNGSFSESEIIVGVTFSNQGQAFVWDKDGKVFIVNGASKQLLIDITDEVGSWWDHGLNGFALDPNYLTNGYVYLLYVVDRYDLFNSQGSYDPGANQYEEASIGRITRYTIDNPSTNPVVDYNSRLILLGTNHTNGFPITTDNHGVGSLVFGTDGTLLASNGDGANVHYNNSNGPFAAQAKSDGILRQDEALNQMRCQDTTSLSGKIIRIDPLTGNGIPSNPYYDESNPSNGQSKV